jgi:saccharopine dehydrogenase-like NADP-dependent oxidoreductase
MKRVLILGGGGAMARAAIASAAACSAVGTIVVADRIKAAAERAVAAIAQEDAVTTPIELDLFDHDALGRAIAECDAVLNCAGPFYKTGVHVLEAAIAAKRPYLDICDDWEPTKDMLRLDGAARAAGITAVIGMGASPGVTNLLARVAASELDRCDSLVTGRNLDGKQESILEAERRVPGSHAAILHWLHQLSGEIEIWRNGRTERAKPFAAMKMAPPGLKPRTLYTVGHPAPLTLPRVLPELESVVNVMALSRAETAMARALSARVAAGTLTLEQASAMVLRPANLPFPIRLRAFFSDLADRLAPLPDYPPLFAFAHGMKNSRPRRVAAWVTRLPPPGMAGAIGVPLAVGLKLALTHRLDRHGVFAPEEIIDPHIFFEEFAIRATPKGTAPGPLIHIETVEEEAA